MIKPQKRLLMRLGLLRHVKVAPPDLGADMTLLSILLRRLI
jgi:hypothetical protein